MHLSTISLNLTSIFRLHGWLAGMAAMKNVIMIYVSTLTRSNCSIARFVEEHPVTPMYNIHIFTPTLEPLSWRDISQTCRIFSYR